MSNDLEQQLRDTFQGRASTVHDGPTWTATTATAVGHHSMRTRWLPATAAAGVVLLIGAGIAAWSAGSGRDHAAANAGVGRPTCTAKLPASWAAARAKAPLSVDGNPAFPEGVGPNGSIVVDWFPPDHSSGIGLIAPNGTTRQLIRIAPKRLEFTHSDAKFVVVSSSPALPATSPDRPVDDIAVINASSGKIRHILAKAPMPAGWVVTGRGAVIQNGIVYWAAQPSPRDQRHGIVISYDIQTGRYRVLDRVSTFPDVEQDRRGVAWPGGSVPASGVPDSVPQIFNQAGNYRALLLSDGSNYAWTVKRGDPHEVHWADSHGNAKIFDVKVSPYVIAVSGSFVFMFNQSDGIYFVLDARTGALASTESDEYFALDSGELFVSPDNQRSSYRVETADLPELHC